MKYILCAVALLLTLAICCCVVVQRITTLTETVSAMLWDAADALGADRWELAEPKISQARALWMRNEGFWGTVMRHSETDALSESLALAQYYAQSRDHAELQSLLVSIQAQLRHLADMEQAYYYNFL